MKELIEAATRMFTAIAVLAEDVVAVEKARREAETPAKAPDPVAEKAKTKAKPKVEPPLADFIPKEKIAAAFATKTHVTQADPNGFKDDPLAGMEDEDPFASLGKARTEAVKEIRDGAFRMKGEAPTIEPMTEPQSELRARTIAREFIQRFQKSKPDGMSRVKEILVEMKVGGVAELSHDQRMKFISHLTTLLAAADNMEAKS